MVFISVCETLHVYATYTQGCVRFASSFSPFSNFVSCDEADEDNLPRYKFRRDRHILNIRRALNVGRRELYGRNHPLDSDTAEIQDANHRVFRPGALRKKKKKTTRVYAIASNIMNDVMGFHAPGFYCPSK